jgi:multicomponent Na+:H+ antiporter subunit A
MALGTLTLLLGQSEPYAITAFATFLVVHSLYKAALFLAIGCVDHGTGTRDARVLGGLLRPMPVTAFAAGLAALSMAGLPPFLGFIAKELMYAASEYAAVGIWVLGGFLFAANALMFAAAGVVAFRPFWRPARGEMPVTPHEAPWDMLAGPVILALLGGAFGWWAVLVEGNLIHPVVDAVSGGSLEPRGLVLWAGVNLPLYLSLATFAVGFVLYLAHVGLRGVLERLTPMSFDDGWDRFLDGLRGFAAWQSNLLQGGVLRIYMATIFWTLLLVIGATGAMRGIGTLDLSLVDGGEREPKHYAVVALIVLGTMVTAIARSRIASVAALGAVGIGVALVFIMYGAPDVAITQLLVETLIVVLVAVVMLRLPFLTLEGVSEWRPLDAVLALGIGVAVTAVILAVLAVPLDPRLTVFFEDAAWTEAYGRNIVNVILVDFRALDTFGEIAVVAVAAFGAYALLRTRTPRAIRRDPGAVARDRAARVVETLEERTAERAAERAAE